MHTQAGSCPHCGAPIWIESISNSIMPPAPIFTCSCTASARKTVTCTGPTFDTPLDRARVVYVLEDVARRRSRGIAGIGVS